MKKRLKLKVGQVVRIKSKEAIDAWATSFNPTLGGFVNDLESFFFPAERLYLCGMEAKVCGVENKFNKTLYTLEVKGGRISDMYFIRGWLEKVNE